MDNARPHPGKFLVRTHILTLLTHRTDPNDPDLLREGHMDGWDIRLCCQPANSPDMNILDLGYFRSIQSLQHQCAPSNMAELVKAVEESFAALSRDKLDYIFLSLQACMLEVLKEKGGNKYKLPHLGKAKLSREDKLPKNLICPEKVLIDAYVYVESEFGGI